MYLATPALWPALIAFLALALPMLVTDARESRLPLPLNVGLLGAGAILLPVASIWVGTDRLIVAALSLVAAAAIMFVLFIIARGGLGFGDVILVAGLSFYAGFASPLAVLIAIWLGCTVTLAWALLRRRRGIAELTPFGPGLIVSTLLTLLIPIGTSS